MAKYLQPPCEYCYTNGYDLRFNEELKDDEGNIISYGHRIIIHLILLDADKSLISSNSFSMIMDTTNKMLTTKEGFDLIDSPQVRMKFITEIARLKKEYSGYDFKLE